MPKILGADTGKLSLGDAFMIAGAKTVLERLSAPIIGNASYMSGGVKVVSAVLFNKFLGGKLGDIVGTALAVDGTEDIVNAGFSQFGLLNAVGGESGATVM